MKSTTKTARHAPTARPVKTTRAISGGSVTSAVAMSGWGMGTALPRYGRLQTVRYSTGVTRHTRGDHDAPSEESGEMVWSKAPPMPESDKEVAYVLGVAARIIDRLFVEVETLGGPQRAAEARALLVAEVKAMSGDNIGLDEEARALRFALWLVDHTTFDGGSLHK
jgi:hypothetical protein